MTDTDTLIEQLQALWHDDFPLTRAMRIQVQDFDGDTLTTRTTLEGNTNTHGTAFAGSLYTAQALTAWSLLHLQLQQAGLDGSIIHGHAEIDFNTTVTQDIVVQASFSGHEHHLQTLHETGKTRLELTAQVVAEERPASTFTGLYVVRLAR